MWKLAFVVPVAFFLAGCKDTVVVVVAKHAAPPNHIYL